MNSSLSVPTDNPYKFMTVIGLVLTTFSIYFLFSQGYSYNDKIFKSIQQVADAKSNAKLSEEQKEVQIAIAERVYEISVEDSKYLPLFCAFGVIFGSILLWYGFTKWIKEAYPVEAEIKKLQLQNIKLQNAKLKRSTFQKRA